MLISTNQTTTVNVVGSDGETRLDEQTWITTATYGIVEAAGLSGNLIAVDGFITNRYGVEAAGDGTKITVGQSGIIASSEIAVQAIGTNQSIVNSGSIAGSSYGIYQNSSSAISIENHGLISGNNAIHASSASGGGSIVNAADATISGKGYGLYLQSQPGTGWNVTNDGLISGAIRSMGTGDHVIVNHGTLDGQVLLGDGNDVLDSRGGTITDFIALGAGNDTIDLRKATFSNHVYGGAGDDLFLVSSSAVFIEEAGGEGHDTVKSSAYYSLDGKGEIEDLVLLGKARRNATGSEFDNALTGNRAANRISGLDGQDVLDGGKGADRLTGGAGGDVFLFKPKFGRDTIVDFEDGVDHIRFDGIAALADFGDVKSHMSRHGDDVVIALGDHSVTIRDVKLSELTAADFTWMV